MARVRYMNFTISATCPHVENVNFNGLITYAMGKSYCLSRPKNAYVYLHNSKQNCQSAIKREFSRWEQMFTWMQFFFSDRFFLFLLLILICNWHFTEIFSIIYFRLINLRSGMGILYELICKSRCKMNFSFNLKFNSYSRSKAQARRKVWKFGGLVVLWWA